MKTPQFLQPAVNLVRAAWMAGPWRVLGPLHETGAKMVDRALDKCRDRYPQYYLYGARASGMASFAVAFVAGERFITMGTLLYAATTVAAGVLPVVAGIAAAAALVVAVGALRKSSRRTESYFLYERGCEMVPVPEAAPAPLPKPAKKIFNRAADVTTGTAVTPMKALKLKPPENTGVAP